MVEPPAITPLAAAAERDVLLATKLHVPRPRPGFVTAPGWPTDSLRRTGAS